MPFTVVLDWGERSRRLRATLVQKVSGPSFWLTPAVPPVQLGIVAPHDVGRWDVAQTVPLAVTTDLANQTATGTVPDGMSHVRLDFDLSATVDGQTSIVLSFKQMFLASSPPTPAAGNASGVLLPVQFSFADSVLTSSPNGPVAGTGSSATGRRNVLGLHPLMSLAAVGRFSINAEFVDATELWWKLHPDTTWGWYWQPELKGRQEHLRVLAWTGGGNPMIWFAVIPDAAVPVAGGSPAPSPSAKPEGPADIVYLRPPPGSNAFVYAPDAKGFARKEHDLTTLRNLARYLLSPIPEATFLSLQASGTVRAVEMLADQVQPKKTNPITPANPMSLMWLSDTKQNPDAFTDTIANAFRPVGLEAAVNRTGTPHVLFLPLGFTADATSNPQGGYEAVLVAGLKTTIQSALTLLWSVNALGRNKAAPMAASERQLWVAGHSEGNIPLWTCLGGNARDIERIISFDAKTLKPMGLPAMKAAGVVRKKAGQTLDAFVIVTPATGGAIGLTDPMDVLLRQLRDNGTLVTVLPDFDQRIAYWHLQPRPPAITNPLILHLLAKWNVPTKANAAKTLLEVSADSPGLWGFIFFHEMAVFGGELVQPPAPAPSTPSGPAAPVPPPFVRTFFEMALGPANPRPPRST